MKYTYVLVCGTRTFKDVELLYRKLKRLLKNLSHPIIVHGGATGADDIAEGWCLYSYVPFLTFPAAWRPFGTSEVDPAAGPKRNEKMVRFVARHRGFCIAFWNGRSKGTKDLITRAARRKIPTRVILYSSRRKSRRTAR